MRERWVTSAYNSVTNTYASKTIWVPKRARLVEVTLSAGTIVVAVAASTVYGQLLLGKSSDIAAVSSAGPDNVSNQLIAALIMPFQSNATTGQSLVGALTMHPELLVETGPLYAWWNSNANVTIWGYVHCCFEAV